MKKLVLLTFAILGIGSFGISAFAAQCTINSGLPDHTCTPGAAFPNVTKEKVCAAGYAKSVRDVSASVKKQVYAEYGITSHATGQYEVDHLISLELGGSNDHTNLWPEAASPKPGYHEKDKIENYLHKQVCAGAMTLEEAQKEISTNWLVVKVSTTTPKTTTVPAKKTATSSSSSKAQCLIKGNITSKGQKVYHLPGCPSYSSTKIDTTAGERWFCSETEAVAAGWTKVGNCH